MATTVDSDAPAIKIVVAGGGAAPLTGLLAAACDRPPLSTTVLTTTASGVTPPSTAPASVTHSFAGARSSFVTVAEFGWTVLPCGDSPRLVYLFGVRAGRWPWSVWDDLCRAAAGLLVLIDPDEPTSAAAVLDYATAHDLPYLNLIGALADVRLPSPADLRGALALPPYAPLVVCDPSNRREVHTVLGLLVDHALHVTARNDIPGGSPCLHDRRAASVWPLPASASPCCWR